MMAKPRPKEVMEWEAVNLIRTVTELQDEEENFEICERFVMSNLLYHKVDFAFFIKFAGISWSPLHQCCPLVSGPGREQGEQGAGGAAAEVQNSCPAREGGGTGESGGAVQGG